LKAPITTAPGGSSARSIDSFTAGVKPNEVKVRG